MSQPQDVDVRPANGSHDDGAGSTVVVRRSIPATVDEVFDAWLDAGSLAQWMHPGTSLPSSVQVDARVGGQFEVVMHYPDGPKRHHGEYRVIERNRKLVFTWFSDATHHVETLVTVEFHVAVAGTEIVLIHERMPDRDAGASHGRGWTGAFELLEHLLSHPTSTM